MNLTSIPIIGALIQKGENILASGVQQIKERVADFHLIPRRVQNFQARANQLSQLQTVNRDTDAMGVVVNARARTQNLQSNYDSANRQLDLAMTEVQKVQAGNVSIAGAGLVASTIKMMNDVFSSASTIDNLLSGVEQKYLTPQQLSNVKSLGAAQSSSPVSGQTAMIVLALGAGIILLGRRRRRS